MCVHVSRRHVCKYLNRKSLSLIGHWIFLRVRNVKLATEKLKETNVKLSKTQKNKTTLGLQKKKRVMKKPYNAKKKLNIK